MSDFPPAGMAQKEDSAFFSIDIEDNTVRSSMEGGYEFTRPRTTRAARKTFKTGFTNLSQADKDLVETFYNAKKAGAIIFTYTNPTNTTVHDVRFAGPISFNYVGIGGTHRWDIQNIELKEV